jgi:hypothetical protein
MTRDEAREFAKLVQAYADGEQIQFHFDDGEWRGLSDPDFYSRTMDSYRIKPEPREWWVLMDRNGQVGDLLFSLAAAHCEIDKKMLHGVRAPYTIVHVREVMP